MLALQLIALFFLALSVVFCFGPRLVVYGPRALGEMARQGQVQLVGACLTSILVMIVMAPHLNGAVSTDSGELSVAMLEAIVLSASLA